MVTCNYFKTVLLCSFVDIFILECNCCPSVILRFVFPAITSIVKLDGICRIAVNPCIRNVQIPVSAFRILLILDVDMEFVVYPSCPFRE